MGFNSGFKGLKRFARFYGNKQAEGQTDLQTNIHTCLNLMFMWPCVVTNSLYE